ncbi:hypothetical protein PIB30_038491 [Stylosanthes scabra]|uniref:GRF-type domain-containing protein n=1 Tax=Stylosanthes scabra TaxID=79078 RepID=A0ABU6RE40_9FABA|nr:hypothetical protein [Stylosanthes scabra]
MATSQRKKSTQSCGSACFGSPSFVKNRKKKFDYNNGKCLHDLDGVMLQSGTQWNPGRLFLRCPLWKRPDLRCDYFVWADEIKDDEKNIGVQERIEESYNKVESHLDAQYTQEDVKLIMNTMSSTAEELKIIRKLIHGIFVGIGVLAAPHPFCGPGPIPLDVDGPPSGLFADPLTRSFDGLGP